MAEPKVDSAAMRAYNTLFSSFPTSLWSENPREAAALRALSSDLICAGGGRLGGKGDELDCGRGEDAIDGGGGSMQGCVSSGDGGGGGGSRGKVWSSKTLFVLHCSPPLLWAKVLFNRSRAVVPEASSDGA